MALEQSIFTEKLFHTHPLLAGSGDGAMHPLSLTFASPEDPVEDDPIMSRGTLLEMGAVIASLFLTVPFAENIESALASFGLPATFFAVQYPVASYGLARLARAFHDSSAVGPLRGEANALKFGASAFVPLMGYITYKAGVPIEASIALGAIPFILGLLRKT